MIRRILVMVSLILVAACDDDALVETDPVRLSVGDWGGENAGVLVSPTTAHVHVGCTLGDFPAPIELDGEGRFSVTGSYLVRAFPIAVGPTMPAQFAGVVRNGSLTLTVAVNDTIQKQLIVLGPVTVTFGREARMGPCPICEMTLDR